MKNKLLNRILIVAVAIIWGKYIWDWVANKQMTEELEAMETNQQMTFAPLLFDKDTFDLQLPDWDPFLNTGRSRYRPIKSSPPKENQKQKKVKKKKPEPKHIRWPKIRYFGFVSNRSHDSPLCLLEINGHKKKVNEGETFNEVKIEEVYHDSIRLVFGGKEKVVLKGLKE